MLVLLIGAGLAGRGSGGDSHTTPATTVVSTKVAEAVVATARPAPARTGAAGLARAAGGGVHSGLAAGLTHVSPTASPRPSATPVPPTSTPVPTNTPKPTSTPGPTATLTAAQWDATAAIFHDTYRQVSDHPEDTSGDPITWTCNIAKFLGNDPTAGDTAGWEEVGCLVYRGAYTGGTGDGEALLLVNPFIDTSAMDSGDDLAVRGTVGYPYQATNAFGGTIMVPTIRVVSLVEKGTIPTRASAQPGAAAGRSSARCHPDQAARRAPQPPRLAGQTDVVPLLHRQVVEHGRGEHAAVHLQRELDGRRCAARATRIASDPPG